MTPSSDDTNQWVTYKKIAVVNRSLIDMKNHRVKKQRGKNERF